LLKIELHVEIKLRR